MKTAMATSIALLCGCTSEHTLPACVLDAGASTGTASDPVLIAAGDIAECGNDGAARTAKMLDALDGTIAALGDNVYDNGSLDEYLECYEPTWGRHRARTRPTVGNHEYGTPRAGAYFAYFCGVSGEPYKGWYSYELGAWHVVVLNSNCAEVGCDEDSEQARWLRDDLAAHPAHCTLAYWHHPRFSSGEHGDDASMSTLYEILYNFGADVLLTGHEHNYERFAALSPAGELDLQRGLREFVVGTGGRAARPFARARFGSELRRTGELGVLALTLHDGSYDWRFIREGFDVTDIGHAACH